MKIIDLIEACSPGPYLELFKEASAMDGSFGATRPTTLMSQTGTRIPITVASEIKITYRGGCTFDMYRGSARRYMRKKWFFLKFTLFNACFI